MNILFLLTAAAGATLALRSGKSSLDRLPSFPGSLEVRSSLPGRLRLEIPLVQTNPARVQEMRTQLLSTGAFSEITINPVTNSVLFCYDAKVLEPIVLEGAVVRLLHLENAIETRPNSQIYKDLTRLFHALDNGIYDATGGLVSGRMALCIGLLGTAIERGVVQGIALPGSATLLWWASGIFRRDGTGE